MNVLVSTAAVAAAVPTAAFPIAAKPDQSDARLIELEQVIMTEYAKATEHDDEIDRLSAISAEEYCRLAKALYVVAASEIRCPTKEEKDAIWDKVYGISEFDDESRLKKLCEPHWKRVDTLTNEMWAIPAKTSRGRNAKLNVLLTTIMSDTWLACDEDVDYDAEQARKLLLEFAGDEVSEPWTARFARPSERIPGEQARTNDDCPSQIAARPQPA